MTESELAAIRERVDSFWSGLVSQLKQARTDLMIDGQAEMVKRSCELAHQGCRQDVAALLAEVDILRGLLSDRVQDSDLAMEAVRRERARCVAMADKMRRREEAKLKERGADDWLNGRINALSSLAQRMEDAP